MKSRIQPTDEAALLYLLDEGTARGDKARAVLREMGVEAITVSPAMLGQKLGFCAKLPGFAQNPVSYAGPPVESEAVILRDLTRERLDALLAALAAAGVGDIYFKAMVTQYNRDGPMLALFAELEKERGMIAAYQRVQALTRQARELGGEPLTEAADSAEALLRDGPESLERLLECAAKLESLLASNARA